MGVKVLWVRLNQELCYVKDSLHICQDEAKAKGYLHEKWMMPINAGLLS